MYGIPQAAREKLLGKLVKGQGTGTSDSVAASVPVGTYILPADTTATLKKGLGAPGYGEKQVQLSNGEQQIPPEEVHGLGVRFLNMVKDATHQPAPDANGQGPKTFFANGGLVEDDEQPRLNPQGIRAMTAQSVQATRQGTTPAPGGQQPAGRGVPGWQTLQDGLAGGAKALVGAALVPHAAMADAVRNGAALIAGGDPDSLDGGSAKYRDKAVGNVTEGWDQASGAAQQFRDVSREALGAKPLGSAHPPAASPAAPAAPIAGATAQPAGDAPPAGRGVPGWQRTGIGADRQGGEIAMRQGANGITEFTNEAATPGAVSAGRGAPAAGSRPAARPQPRLGVPGYGSAANVGDGVGTFSQAEAGSAQLALERFERAGEEREKMIAASRRGALGEGGGRVTVVRDSSRSPTLAEIQNDRLESRQLQDRIDAADAGTRAAEAGQRMGTEQLNQQRLQQQIEEGALGVQDRLRIDQLRAQINDPNLSDQQRATALEAYNNLAVSPDARLRTQQQGASDQQKLIGDLYKAYSNMLTPPMVGEGENARPLSFEEWLQPAMRAIQGGEVQASAQAAAPAAAVQALKQDPERAAQFDRKYGAGAAARALQS